MKNTGKQLKPIQLISFDGDKNLKLSQSASSIINQMNAEQLYVVIVAGKYRTGKSYILNRVLLNKNSGFEVGPTINACTKGLWMWPELVDISDHNGKIKKCIIIDTQGLGSLEEGQNTDIKIFLMAILLSSYLIYNSVGNIDEKALENLSLVINLAQMLHKQNNQYDAQELINSFPSFMWLVRDFSLRLEDEKGEPITCQQYLEMALKYQNPTSNAAQRKNLIRKKLKTFFYDRNCFTLIRPTENEKDLQNLSKLSQKKLRPEFVKLINEFQSVIHSELRPKKVRGKSITPQGFIQLCKYFVEMINSGKLPTISSHWDNLCVRESSRIIDDYVRNHGNRLIDSFYSNSDEVGQYYELSIDEKLIRIEMTHKRIKEQAWKKIEKSFLGKLQKQLSKERLERSLEKIYEQTKLKISEQKFCKVKEIIQEIFSEILMEFSANKLQSFEQIFARFQQIKQKYRHDTRIYQSFYQNSKDVFQQFLRSLKSQWDKEQEILFIKNNQLKQALENKNLEIKNLIDRHTQSIREYEKKEYRHKLQFQQKVSGLQLSQKQLDRIKNENKKMIQQMKQLKKVGKMSSEEDLKLMKAQFSKQVTDLRRQNKSLRIEMARLEEGYKDVKIKERKNCRQMEIFKNKCSEYLKDNINLSEEIDALKKKILESQKQVRKSTMIYHSKSGSSDQISQFIEQLNNKINHLQFTLTSKEQELRAMGKLLSDERATNETLLKAPQNMNYQMLKKNYERQCQNSGKITEKLKEYENLFILCSFKCLLCKEKNIDRGNIRAHVKKCIGNKQLDFDVSYEYNGNGDIQYVIDVVVNSYEKEWTTRKTNKNVKLFLKKLYETYPKTEKSALFESKGHSKSDLEQDEAQIQERRAYLNQIFNEYRLEAWSNSFMLQFFAVDIHYLNQKITHIPQTLSLKAPSSKKSSSRVSSELSIELDDLADENIDPYGDQSQLMMRTCKFSKKTFNFGPEM